MSRADRCGFAVLDAEKRAKLCGKPATTTRDIDGIPFPACDTCAAAHDAGQGPRDVALNFGGDPAAVRAFFADLRSVVEDAESVTEDMLRPLRARTLGPRKQRQLYREARKALHQLLDYADPPPNEPERGE